MLMAAQQYESVKHRRKYQCSMYGLYGKHILADSCVLSSLPMYDLFP